MSLEDDFFRQRRARIAEIEELGHRGYGQRFDFTHTVSQVLAEYGSKTAEELTATPGQEPRVRIAGRIQTVRRMGKAGFMHLMQSAERIWTSPSCARFFRGPALRWSGNEVPVAEAGEVLRIDRLVALADGDRWIWWVLDYKLRHAPEELEAYRAQLTRYARAVRALQPGAEVRAAFITGAGSVIEVGTLDEATLTADGSQTMLAIEERGMPLDQIAAYGVGVQLHIEDLAAYIAGGERLDAATRLAGLLPAYRELAAEIS